MDYKAIYQSKLGTLEGALELIKSGDTIATPIYGNEPTQFLKRLHTIALRVENVTLWTMLMMGEYPVMTDNSLKGSIDIFTFFYNNDCRKGHDTGRFQLAPLNLHAVGRTVVTTRRPSVFVAAVSSMDGLPLFRRPGHPRMPGSRRHRGFRDQQICSPRLWR